MAGKICFAVLLALLVQGGAHAASVEIDVRDQGGHPVAGAVVALLPVEANAPMPQSRLPLQRTIDQRHETFLPLVTILRKGGRVVFTNHDTTMHQVYSFSGIKQFAFEIDQGQKSEPVVFDRAGIAAIGCNIHDHMIAYVYVAESPWTAPTDAAGRALFDTPEGAFRATVWHPRLPPGTPPPVAELAVPKAGARTSVTLSLLDDDSGKTHMHMQMY